MSVCRILGILAGFPGYISNYFDQTLCAMSDNDFNAEHTAVTAWQRAGTLERQVKYDREAFKKAWDYLAASPSDSEED